MDIFLVRHGETDGNIARRHQHANTPLNEKGIGQAKKVAEILKDYNLTHLISSIQKRALTTAMFVSQSTGLIPETSEDIIEIIRPDYLVGERRTGWKMVTYMSLWYFGYRPASRHDGETYTELRQRIARTKKYLATLPQGSRVVVVSHAGFITFFLAHLNYDRALSFFGALRVTWRMLSMRNTQISHLTYNKDVWHIEN